MFSFVKTSKSQTIDWRLVPRVIYKLAVVDTRFTATKLEKYNANACILCEYYRYSTPRLWYELIRVVESNEQTTALLTLKRLIEVI